MLVANWSGSDRAPARVEVNVPRARRHVHYLRLQVADQLAVSAVDLKQCVFMAKVPTHFAKGGDQGFAEDVEVLPLSLSISVPAATGKRITLS